MEKKKINMKTLCNSVCIVFMVVIIALQILPYWTFNGQSGEITMSIADICWFPNSAESKEFKQYIQPEAYPELSKANPPIIKDSKTGNPRAMRPREIDAKLGNQLALLPVTSFALAIFAIVGIILKRKSSYAPALMATIVGAAALIAYIFNPALRAGGAWIAHLIVSIVIFLGSLGLFLQNLPKKED